MKIRIGKDLNIRWSILTNNEPTPLEGRNLNLLLQDPSRQQRALSFTTEGNTVISYIPAADLARLGDYILTLKENEGEEGQTVVDAKPAFTLVEYSTEESTEPTDPSLSVADITLSTANLTNGITIQDVFGGEDGGTIQEGDIVPVLRDGVLTRASQAAISTPESGGEIVYKGIIHKAVPANPRKGYAYIFRGINFIPVFRMDQSTNLNKYIVFFRGNWPFYRLKNGNPSYECYYQVIGYNPYDGRRYSLSFGSIYESPEETSLSQKEIEENIIRFRVDPCNILIRLYSRYSFDGDIAVFIEDEDLNLYNFGSSYIAYIKREPIKMESPRFFIENNKVYCKEIPSIVSTKTDDGGETVFNLGNRVNVLRQKTLGHSLKRYNHWIVEKEENNKHYTNVKSAKRYPIKLVCGETKAFRRRNGKYRGCSIHSIESNGMHLINELGGVMNIDIFI